MIDKTNNSKIKQTVFSLKKHINKMPNKTSEESQDSFIKGIYKDKLIKSDEQMASVLGMNSFKYLTKNLVEKGYFHNGTDAIKLYLDSEQPIVAVGITNFNTEITEQYQYTPDEFMSLLEKIKEKAIQCGKESTDEYKELYSALIKKLQIYSQKKP